MYDIILGLIVCLSHSYLLLKQTIYKRCQDFDVGHGQILGGIAASDVDALEKYFPPCMRHLLQSLRRNHRLKHYSRVCQSLYLTGLSLKPYFDLVMLIEKYSFDDISA